MIEIKCRGADTLPLDSIEDFQGGLKKRTKKEIDQIIKSIKQYGFSFPFFVWNGTGHIYCLDGHGRIQALSQMRQAGEDLPLFPVVYIDAKDEEEAKQKLLRMNSNFGMMTIGSVLEFTSGMEIEWGDLDLPDGGLLQMKTEIIELPDGFENAKKIDLNDKICPNCGFVLGKTATKKGAKSYFGDELNDELH